MKILTFGHWAIVLAVCQLALAMPSDTQAAGKAATLATDCATDINKYCSNVTPGDDRVVACLIAYEDKVEPRCRLTAYLASGNLGIRMKQLQVMSKTCSSDIVQYCSKVAPGGGRIFDCIKANKATLTDECRKGLESLSPL